MKENIQKIVAKILITVLLIGNCLPNGYAWGGYYIISENETGVFQ